MHKYVASLAEKSEAIIFICTILFYLVNGASMVLRHSSAGSLGSNCCIYLQKIKKILCGSGSAVLLKILVGILLK